MPGTVFFKTELPADVSVLMEPLTIALHATDRARVGLGRSVVVQGTGAIGLMAVACAKLAGAFPIIAIGGPSGRLETALRLGAHHSIDINVTTDPEERHSLVLGFLGSDLGADAVIGCAGQPSAFLEGLALVASGGVMSEAGHFTDAGSIPFNPYSDLLWRNISVEGVLGAGPDSVGRFCRSIALLEQHDLPYELIVSHKVSLERLEEAFVALSSTYRLDGRDIVKLAVDPWQ
jgi:L-iditol 2-dehydrogenase